MELQERALLAAGEFGSEVQGLLDELVALAVVNLAPTQDILLAVKSAGRGVVVLLIVVLLPGLGFDVLGRVGLHQRLGSPFRLRNCNIYFHVSTAPHTFFLCVSDYFDPQPLLGQLRTLYLRICSSRSMSAWDRCVGSSSSLP